MALTLEDFDFTLPSELIAQHPREERRESRLMHVNGSALADLHFHDLPCLIKPGDLLVFNNTRVIKARLYGKKETGGKVDILIERIQDKRRAIAQIRTSKPPKPGNLLVVNEEMVFRVVGRCDRQNEFFSLELADTADNRDNDFYTLLDNHGHMPLPPYISREARKEDEARYQTVYAKHPGAVAAPTAGLHFDEPLLAELIERGVRLAFLTLHVGAGTFQPVRESNITAHRMHSEYFDLPEETVEAVEKTKEAGGCVIAVGTTSLRALEAAAGSGEFRPGSSQTALFITPGYQFKVVDKLVTNFHLPKSTLLMLVSAFAGMDAIKNAYQHAIDRRYRFFSYGDAMLLERNLHAI